MKSCAAIANRRACRLPTGTQFIEPPHKRTHCHARDSNRSRDQRERFLNRTRNPKMGALYQGTTSVVPQNTAMMGFSPWALEAIPQFEAGESRGLDGDRQA
jgi:hypothetical protein